MEVKFTVPTPDLSFLSNIKISHIILVSAMLRLFVMPFPNDGGKIFDEAHYVGAVTKILEGVHANPEHPPLTKLIVAGFIKIFGNYWFAWRAPMIICSLASTYLVYLIAKEFFDERLALLASSFIIFDMIWFIHGNIYMLEPPCMTFGLLFVLLYLRGRYKWSAASFSLSCLANEKALFFLLGMGMYAALTHGLKKVDKPTLKKIGTFVLIVGLIGYGGMATFSSIMPPSKASNVNINVQHTIIQDDQGETLRTETATTTQTNQVYLKNPLEHVLWMWSYYSGINTNLKTPQENFRPPWNWITPFVIIRSAGEDPGGNPGPALIRIFNPSQYLVTVVSAGDKKDFIIRYQAQVPIFIWYMTIPVVLLSLYHWKEKESKFILAWVFGTYVPWLVKDLVQKNMCFVHYAQFTIPIMCIGIPWFWKKTIPKYWKQITAVHLICTIVFFFCFFPVGLRRTIT